MSEMNRRRRRALHVSRSFKAVFAASAARVPAWLIAIVTIIGAVLGARWAYRLAMRADDVTVRIAAQHVLADLRDFSFARTSAFDPDPIVMARRQGRRDVWLRISNYLNLDEAVVQQLMEIDDGI